MKRTVKTVLTVVAMSICTLAVGQKKVHSFGVSRIIEAPAAEIWKVVGEDFGAIAYSHPKIVSSDYINGTLKSGEGAERQCNFNDKATKYVREKQVKYDPENYTFKVVMYHAGGLPLDPENTYAIYKVEEIDENSSRLMMDMEFRTKPAFMGAMAKGKFKKTLENYLLAVEHHVLTGEKVTKDNFKEIRSQYGS